MTSYRIALILTTLLAFGLRFYNLDYHSLWFDEALSVHWARQSVPRILEVGFTLVEDRLPPLYYLMLKGWTLGAGFSEVGVRSLTVFIGTLQIPAVAAISSKLFNRQVATLAALLTALNPFLIWYAQEARMYAPAALFSTLSVWAFLKMVESDPHPSPLPEGEGATILRIALPSQRGGLRGGGGG
ncbi:MAG: glycosyltransferase family 39 protein, partial [Anaerolineae bacterium]|nr:glycosyltransferase family 39 protein [Anaerolineae bacterium]